MNKKGQTTTSEIVLWTFVILIFSFLMILLTFGVLSFHNKLTFVPTQTAAQFTTFRFTESPDCFLYPNSKIIDLAEFTNDKLAKCYQTEPIGGLDTFNFRLKLEKADVEITTDKYRNKDDFSIIRDVVVKDGEKVSKDTLIIYVQEV